MNCDIHKNEILEEKGERFDGHKKEKDFWCAKCKEHKYFEVTP